MPKNDNSETLVRARLNWNALSPGRFEEFCADLLRKLGFTNVEWHGEGGSDRGRDIIAEKFEELFFGRPRRLSVIAQCKHRRRVTPSDLSSTFAWADAHHPDLLLLMTTATLTSATRDWLAATDKARRYRVYTLERCDLELQVAMHPDLIQAYFGAPGDLLDATFAGNAIACGYCHSNRTGRSGYFVMTHCDSCTKVAAVCTDCVTDAKQMVVVSAVHCVGCGQELYFGESTVYFNLDVG